MSGIVGIVNFDRSAVDRRLLQYMTEFMAFRGPDRQEIWSDGCVGFGHTLLGTTAESACEHQPFTLDGCRWIVADARVDARRDLIAKLEAHEHAIAPSTTDVELILRAYEVWGEDCVEHLLGDFVFVIWDGLRKRLFCARDHLGVKPLFYANCGRSLILSNTLDCIRRHPAVSDKLNDQAVADFLLFGLNQEPATTSFADIQRVPPAHRAEWSASGLHMSRYWTLAIDEPLYYRRASDYTERFLELLKTAIDDRLRVKKVGIFMSGGLDSTTLAATACSVLGARSTSFEVRAFTTLVAGVADNKERYYAEMVADRLGIPISYRDLMSDGIDPSWSTVSSRTPEPVPNPVSVSADQDYYQGVSAQTRVCFYGEGPDNALQYEWWPYLSHLARRRRFGRILWDVSAHLAFHRRIPLLPTLARFAREWRSEEWWRSSFPDWIDGSFESRLKLRARWEEAYNPNPARSPHPVRPIAYNSFTGVLWEGVFREFDAEVTRAALEVRHPFVDLRLLRYMLAVPPIPWCRGKYLVRSSMRHSLPHEVLRRPKAPIANDMQWLTSWRPDASRFAPVAALRHYVDTDRLSAGAGLEPAAFWREFRPQALNHWLRNLQGLTYHTGMEGSHGSATEERH